MEKSDAYHILNQAIHNFKKEEYDRARTLIDEALTIDPDLPELHYWRGIIEGMDLNLEKLKIAAAEFTEAIDKNPEYTDAYIERGKIYLLKKRYDKAKQDFEKALQLEPERKEIYKYLAEVYIAEGDKEKALEFMKKSGKEETTEYLLNLAKIFLNTGNYDEALSLVEKVEQKEGQNIDTIELKAKIFEGKKEYQKAVDYYKLAAELKPTQEEYFIKITNLYYQWAEEEYQKGDYVNSAIHIINGLEIHNEILPDFDYIQIFKKAVEQFYKKKEWKKVVACLDYMELHFNEELGTFAKEMEKKLPLKHKIMKKLNDIYAK